MIANPETTQSTAKQSKGLTQNQHKQWNELTKAEPPPKNGQQVI